MKNSLKIMSVIIVLGILNLFCSTPATPSPEPPPVTQTVPPTVTPTIIPPTLPPKNIYYVSMSGNDDNPGTLDQPWLTIKKAVETLTAGDLVYIRAGQYEGLQGGWVFRNSGTQAQSITIANYPGEQVVFRITSASAIDHYIFRCSINPHNPSSWQTPKADYIHVIGSDVEPQILSNGVESKKGIVIQGMEGEQSAGIYASDCDHWVVSGVDFVETAYGIFTEKNNWHQPEEHSTDYWYVHDNRVYNYYRESGMQFNGNFNLIENNEIYKVSDRLDTPHGCQLLNLVGNNNVVRGNTFSRMGSAAECLGILFEWDLSDANLIEQNTISDVPSGIVFQGGDANIIQDNSMTASAGSSGSGIKIASYDNRTEWPCNDYIGSGSSAEALIPPDDPTHPDYPYYYTPRNCHSMNNQIIRNTIVGFKADWILGPAFEDSNIFIDNIVSPP
ncbi:MAG: right-handed parallel beta-helix repeat-containing protein [Anaerolineales bacterium]|nr:right-handed parallel beta-helix repeat-containing protein [Anaerolineales bacterium]